MSIWDSLKLYQSPLPFILQIQRLESDTPFTYTLYLLYRVWERYTVSWLNPNPIFSSITLVFMRVPLSLHICIKHVTFVVLQLTLTFTTYLLKTFLSKPKELLSELLSPYFTHCANARTRFGVLLALPSNFRKQSCENTKSKNINNTKN